MKSILFLYKGDGHTDNEFKNIILFRVTQKLKLLGIANKVCIGLLCWKLQNVDWRN